MQQDNMSPLMFGWQGEYLFQILTVHMMDMSMYSTLIGFLHHHVTNFLFNVKHQILSIIFILNHMDFSHLHIL